MAFGVADPYLHNASRTNKTSSSGIVREAQREASTDMIWFCFGLFSKATRTVEGEQVIHMERQTERKRGERGGGRQPASLRRQVNSAERFGKVRAQNKTNRLIENRRDIQPAGEAKQRRADGTPVGQLCRDRMSEVGDR